MVGNERMVLISLREGEDDGVIRIMDEKDLDRMMDENDSTETQQC
jgi:hypothetical protein